MSAEKISSTTPESGSVTLARLSEREAITMQMQQVHYFLALCDELNFTRAARRCESLATFADHRHQRARAEPGRSTVSPKAFDRIDRAWAHGAPLPGRNRAQRGSRPRGCTDVDAATGRRPISTSSSGQVGVPIELMPNGSRFGSSCVRVAVDAQTHHRATMW